MSHLQDLEEVKYSHLIAFSFSFPNSHFLVNSADRIIRVYDAKEVITCGKDGDPEPMQRLQDLVNKYAKNPSGSVLKL